MMIVIDRLLDAAEVADYQAQLLAASWEDGAATAGAFARTQKHNLQLPGNAEPAIALGERITQKLWAHPLFISAALPRAIYPPRFNRYGPGQDYGAHVDSALMRPPGHAAMMRTDLSATLFLSDPSDYDGGELEIEGSFGAQSVKLAAGDLVLYLASSLHRVAPVTRGARLASFFWIESLVADDANRAMLFDLDQTIQRLTPQLGQGNPDMLGLTGLYHNLVRRWVVT